MMSSEDTSEAYEYVAAAMLLAVKRGDHVNDVLALAQRLAPRERKTLGLTFHDYYLADPQCADLGFRTAAELVLGELERQTGLSARSRDPKWDRGDRDHPS